VATRQPAAGPGGIALQRDLQSVLTQKQKYRKKISCFSLPSAPTLRPEDQPFALSETGILALFLCVMPGEFASGLTAEGQGKRHNIWREAPTTSPWGTK
jgi:hypothetical protein